MGFHEYFPSLFELFETYQTNLWAPRALIGSCLVGVMCGVLGCFIVLRNMSLIGDALSHAVLPGVVFAFIAVNLIFASSLCDGVPREECINILEPYYNLFFFFGSLLAALIAAVLITWIQKNVRTENDAAIGIVFTTMFSIGVIGISILSSNHSVHLDLQDMLFGNVLGVSDQDMLITSYVTVFVLGTVALFYRQLFATTFQPVVAQTMGIPTNLIYYLLMLILSFAVVASMRMVGVILVVAMLITPAATALLLSNKLKNVIFISAILGFIAAFIGVNISILFNPPPGPVIVLVSTLMYIFAIFISPQKGIIPRYMTKRRMKSSITKTA